MSRVLCAMSGGVDSSVAAALLARQGHEVIGIFLRLGPGGEQTAGNRNSCCSVNDARDAARVASRLGIPFYALNYRQEFDRIIDYFVAEYNGGRTPNPCARCNQWIKFGTLREQARELGCDRIATGHYARLEEAGEGGSIRLLRGADPDKDQSYFLFTVSRDTLPVSLFPVGHLTKRECRELARELDLSVADKPDSQEICFVPGGDYRRVVESRTPERIRAGNIVDISGHILGKHPGHQHFTVGQRRGLGTAFGEGEPRYVVAIDAALNTVTIGPRAALERASFEVDELNWVSIPDPGPGDTLAAEVQIRHRGRPAPSTLRISGKGRARVDLEEPRDAVTPGQAAVFYRGELLLGGGWIV